MDLNHRPQPYKGCALTTELWALIVDSASTALMWALYLGLLNNSRVAS